MSHTYPAGMCSHVCVCVRARACGIDCLACQCAAPVHGEAPVAQAQPASMAHMRLGMAAGVPGQVRRQAPVHKRSQHACLCARLPAGVLRW